MQMFQLLLVVAFTMCFAFGSRKKELKTFKVHQSVHNKGTSIRQIRGAQNYDSLEYIPSEQMAEIREKSDLLKLREYLETGQQQPYNYEPDKMPTFSRTKESRHELEIDKNILTKNNMTNLKQIKGMANMTANNLEFTTNIRIPKPEASLRQPFYDAEHDNMPTFPTMQESLYDLENDVDFVTKNNIANMKQIKTQPNITKNNSNFTTKFRAPKPGTGQRQPFYNPEPDNIPMFPRMKENQHDLEIDTDLLTKNNMKHLKQKTIQPNITEKNVETSVINPTFKNWTDKVSNQFGQHVYQSQPQESPFDELVNDDDFPFAIPLKELNMKHSSMQGDGSFSTPKLYESINGSRRFGKAQKKDTVEQAVNEIFTIPNEISEALISIFNDEDDKDKFNSSCGEVADRHKTDWTEYIQNEGTISIENLPWFGVLYYPRDDKFYYMPVVLVTVQLVAGSAFDLFKLPKEDFRSKARVVLGKPCSKEEGLKIVEYNYHEEFQRRTYSTLVLVQLDLYGVAVRKDIHPICPPPTKMKSSLFYALVPPQNCESSKVTIYEMDYYDLEECRSVYRRMGLDMHSMWPTSVACGKSKTKKKCVWEDGTILVVKQKNKWHLMGFGISGPGCGSPARFVDYLPYNKWVLRSMETMAYPSITRIDDNLIVFRRTSYIQRYDNCDVDEIHYEIYTDEVKIVELPLVRPNHYYIYNITIRTDIDYTCALFRVDTIFPVQVLDKPHIELRSYCKSKKYPFCYQAGTQEIHYYVKIRYKRRSVFKLQLYGRQRPFLSQKTWNLFLNKLHMLDHPEEWDKGIWIPPFQPYSEKEIYAGIRYGE